MIIDGLPTLSAPQGTDEIPVERGTTTYKAALNNLAAAIGAFDLGVPTTILQNGDDLNNCNTVGIYACNNNNIAPNLLHCPTSQAFKMVVMYTISSSYLMQIIYDYKGEAMYERFYNGTWAQTWNRYANDNVSTTSINTSYGDVTSTDGCVLRKTGNVVMCQITHGNGTTFSGLTGIDSICTIPSGYRPQTTVLFTVLARDNGQWANANYVPVLIRVTSSGAAEIRQNKNVLNTMNYISGTATWIVD